MNETLNTILTRRSTRKFSDKPIPEDEMELIVQAALHAPSGMGLQTWQFTVVRNREKIQMLAAAIEKTLDGINVMNAGKKKEEALSMLKKWFPRPVFTS